MAFRRKSARPVNKLRHQVLEDNDGDDNDNDGDDDEEEEKDVKRRAIVIGKDDTSVISSFQAVTTLSNLLSTPALKAARKSPPLETTTQLHAGIHCNKKTIGLDTASSAPLSLVNSAVRSLDVSQHGPQKMIGRETVVRPASRLMPRPFLALPSDIYRDFENLKSATQLDTTELMRKLLQDYTRLTEASGPQQSSEPVCGDSNGLTTSSLVISSSPLRPDLTFHRGAADSVLDLSATAAGDDVQGCRQLSFTDDQIAMRRYAVGDKVSPGDGGVNAVSNREDIVGECSEEDVAPLDLSLPSKQRDDVPELGAPFAPVLSADGTRIFNHHLSDYQRHQVHSQQLFTTQDSAHALSTGSDQSLHVHLNQNKSTDISLSSNSSRSSFLSTSVNSLSNGPAQSYVIDLEPARSPTLTTSINQPSPHQQRVKTVSQHTRDADYFYSSFTRSKLFPSFLMRKIPENSCVLPVSQAQSDLLNNPNVPQHQVVSVLDTPSHVLGATKSHTVLDNMLSREIQDTSRQKKTATLPTYSEAISSIGQSKYPHVHEEKYNASKTDDVENHSTGTQFVAPEQVNFLHSDQHIDVSFVPYSSLTQAASSSPVAPVTPKSEHSQQNALLQKILEHQQQLFTESQKRLTGPFDLNSNQSSLGHEVESTLLAPKNELPMVKSLHAVSSKNPTDILRSENIYHAAHACQDVTLTRREDEIVTTSVPNVINPTQLSVTNLFMDSKAVVMAAVSDSERTSESSKKDPETPGAPFTSVPTAYLMTQTGASGEGLNNLLAIPIINGGHLPSVLTGLQPFAFTPNSLVTQNIGNDLHLPEPITSKQTNQEPNDQLPQLISPDKIHQPRSIESSMHKDDHEIPLPKPDHQNVLHLKNTFHQEANMLPTSYQQDPTAPESIDQSSETKPKPGRPRGRGARSGGMGAVGKEMKLLTENNLFPGVYTSILKLPWSRRSRNKAKAKTVSQMRKEAQAIALAREKTRTYQMQKPEDVFPPTRGKPDLNSGITNGHLSLTDNSEEYAGVSHHELDQKTVNKVHKNTAIGETDSAKQQYLDTIKLESSQDGMIQFPRLDEVLRQSYAMQQILQRSKGIDTEHEDNPTKTSLFKEVSGLSGIKSQLFQNTVILPPADLSASQFQRALETSPLFPLNVTSTEAKEVLISPPEDVGNQHASAASSIQSMLPVSPFASSQFALDNSFKACGQSSDVLLKFGQDRPTSEIIAADTHSKERERPSKSAALTATNVDVMDFATPGEIMESVDSAQASVSNTPAVTEGAYTTLSSAGYDHGLSRIAGSNRTNHDQPEMTLEKKINLLTQQIGLEMSQSFEGTNKPPQNDKRNLMVDQMAIKKESMDTARHTNFSKSADVPHNRNGQTAASTIKGILNQPRCDARLLNNGVFGRIGLGLATSNETIGKTNTTCDKASSASINCVSETMTLTKVSSSNQQPSLLSSTSKTLPVSTPRRKKVSRLLKSDENFMYATFKIKPKGGLTPRKPRRKRKATENIRGRGVEIGAKKNLQTSLASTEEDTAADQSPASTMLWKFHEQYATPGPESQSEFQFTQMETKFREKSVIPSANCSECDDPLLKSKTSVLTTDSKYDLSCIVDGTQTVQRIADSSADSLQCDTMTVGCMTCGQTFRKFYSDPRGSCDSCLSVAPSVISSSKLFSLTDHPLQSQVASTPSSLFSSSSSSSSSSLQLSRSFAGVTTLSFTKPQLDLPMASSPVIVPISSSPVSCLFSMPSLPPSETVVDQSPMNPAQNLVSCNGNFTGSGTAFPSPSPNAMSLLAENSKHTKQDDPACASEASNSPNILTAVIKSPVVSTLASPSPSVSYLPRTQPCISSTSPTDHVTSKCTLGHGSENPINNVKVSGNNLYCSLCRMKFAKICDYLSHVRQFHDKEKKDTGPGILYSFVPSKYNITESRFSSATSSPKRPSRASKTKKSLAHKTLTCPVEDCPHFFREQREMGVHLRKKHPDLHLCPRRDSPYTSRERADLQNHASSTHDRSHGNGDSYRTVGQRDTEASSTIDEVSSEQAGVKDARSDDACSVRFSQDCVASKTHVNSVLGVNGLNSDSFGAVDEMSEHKTLSSASSSVEQDVSTSCSSDLIDDAKNLTKSIDNHVSSANQSVNEKPLQCDFCDYRCRQKNALSWHMRKHPEAGGQYRKYSVTSE
ncbi:zinc finger protein 692 [Elysia marginata]|uniref:Zinc finger protein 692 n=1 Tax=Elysia marginata TaxID=1093978 RepID=A0AAV4IY99_9GAST|nr:zinc finger protein 692 [Elysia marginata]